MLSRKVRCCPDHFPLTYANQEGIREQDRALPCNLLGDQFFPKAGFGPLVMHYRIVSCKCILNCLISGDAVSFAGSSQYRSFCIL